MKTRELLKLNSRYSIVEATYEQKDTEYVVCSNYNPNAEPYKQWSSGLAYCTSLEDAVKVAATRCYSPIHRYILLEMDTCNNVTEKVYSDYNEAYKEFKKLFDDYSSYEECHHAEIVEDYKGNIVGELWFSDGDDIELKIVDIVV